jgi:hypothetical protein
VPGLRREELATLAGVSISYYVRLERGDAAGVSDSVLKAIARVLRLDPAELTHLRELARASTTIRSDPSRSTAMKKLRPAVQALLDTMHDVPAIVHNGRLDVVGANLLAKAVYSTMFDAAGTPNLARFVFLQVEDTSTWPDWSAGADQLVGMLRAAVGHDPHDRGLSDLIGELATQSEPFRRRWAAHDVRMHTNGIARFDHPEVGELTLTYESFTVAAEPGLSLKIYNAEPASGSAEKLRLLASWYASRTDTSTTVADEATPAPRTRTSQDH